MFANKNPNLKLWRIQLNMFINASNNKKLNIYIKSILDLTYENLTNTQVKNGVFNVIWTEETGLIS